MRVIDTFTFYNEFDILEIRLAELYDHVDRFVIVESDYTFTGTYKGFRLEENKDRYAKWWNKVRYIKAVNPPNNGNAWDNEIWQRAQFSQGWIDLTTDDVVIISDADEIPRPAAIDIIRNTDHGLYILNMPLFDLRFNFMRVKYPWNAARAIRGFRSDGEYMRKCEHVPGKTTVTVDHAGWHFSWQGDNHNIINKIKSFSHTEFDNDQFINAIDTSSLILSEKNIFQNDMVVVKVDDYFSKKFISKHKKISTHDNTESI